MNPQPTIDAMRTAAHTLPSGDDRARVRSIQIAQDALDATKAECLAAIASSKDYELDGASTLNTWTRNELRLSAKDASALVRGAATFVDLPMVEAAAKAGQIRADHVAVFTYGLRHLGPDVMLQAQPWLVDVATSNEPGELHRVVRALREAIYPDDLDEAWAKGMDKEDIDVHRVPGGWHVSGFLNPVTGSKFKTVLDSVSAPRDKDDDRTGSQRRVQGFDDLLTTIFQNGLPSDKGVRPQVSVIVHADTVAAAAAHVQHDTTEPFTTRPATPVSEPGTLTGYGAIGPHLLMYLLCVSDLTAFVMDDGGGYRQADVLNVGRTRHDPTTAQRKAVLVRQHGPCAAPGCNHTHLEIHHVIWWSLGGPTDLDQLIGLCVRCHHLLHRGLLSITGTARDGFSFTRCSGRPFHRRRRHRPHHFNAA